MSKRKVTFEGVNEEFDLEDVPPNKKVSLLNTWLHLQLFIVAVVAMMLCCFCSVQSCEPMSGPGSRFKGKHSLDSDEEDEGEEANRSKYNILDSDDVEGMSR